MLVLFVLGKTASLVHAYSHHEKSSHKNSESCFVCAGSNFQNQISLTPNLIFAAAVFYLVFAFRKFDRVKLSYLLFSKAPRAPPVIS
ncbi:MAG: hypothetical protein KA100_04750 [Rickettsiales bacterium]|nr:hypothetical protein [Rickettsiales bacterium]